MKRCKNSSRRSALLLSSSLAALATGDLHAQVALEQAYGGCANTIVSRTIDVDPAMDYRAAVLNAEPGDRVRFAPGDYLAGLSIYNLNGSENRCIVIEGAPGHTSVLVGAPLNGARNVIQIRNSSFVVLRGFRIDGNGTNDIDAIKSEFTLAGHPNPWSHHLSIQDNYIHDFSGNQQQVGVSTKAPAWNWVVARNLIERAGTGMYFGDSDGGDHFVNSLIEYNVVLDPIGYATQIKHQSEATRPASAGSASVGYESLPSTGQTIIRHNVFSKGALTSFGSAARPNLLVGAQPLSGAGSADQIHIYGNFFYDNPTGFEALLQGEGNLAVYSNLFVNPQGPGVLIRPQNGEVRSVRVFRNTVVSLDAGIALNGNPNSAFTQEVVGNLVFADGVSVVGGDQRSNLTGSRADAQGVLGNPTGTPGSVVDALDLYPLAAVIDDGLALPDLAGLFDADRDFDYRAFGDEDLGAYSAALPATMSLPSLGFKPPPATGSDILFSNSFENL